MTEPAPEASASPLEQGLAYGLVLVLSVLLALWGAFLVPFRIGTVLVPVSWLVALVGNAALARAGGALRGPAGAAVPGLLWLSVVLVLFTRGPGGDLVLYTVPALVFLAVGALVSAVSYGFSRSRARVAA